MKKTFLTTALICHTFSTTHSMNHNIEIVDNLMKSSIAIQNEPPYVYGDSYDADQIKREQCRKQASDFYAKAVKLFRNDNPNPKQLTIKKLRDSTYSFLHKHDLDSLFNNLAIGELEVPSIDNHFPFQIVSKEEAEQNYDDKKMKCVLQNDGRYIIMAHHDDRIESKDLFHNEKYNDMPIGGQWTKYNVPSCFCTPNYIRMVSALESYENYFIHESGHYYQKMIYPELNEIEDNFSNQLGIDDNFSYQFEKDYVLYTASEMFAWVFEYRHAIESPASKDYIFLLGMRLPMFYSNPDNQYYGYFMNLAVSLANQPEKKLVDIANQAIDAIKNGVVINDGEDIRTEFTCVSDASPEEYGIDSNGVVRFNAEKNNAIIRDLLSRIGYDPDLVFDSARELTKE